MTAVTDIMLDTETLGTDPGCVILAVGALAFNPRQAWNLVTGQEIAHKHRFEMTISMESCVRDGLVIDPGSLRFWLEQPDEARAAAFKGEHDLRFVLDELGSWLRGITRSTDLCTARIWTHGAPFDLPILGGAYKLLGKREPWVFRMIRDTRTVFDMAGVEYKGKHHNVILDCLAQAEKVCEGFGILGLHQPELLAA